MTRNREPQRIRRTDFIPGFGLTNYALRVSIDLEEHERKIDKRNIRINTAALLIYNVAVGIGLDRLLGTDYLL